MNKPKENETEVYGFGIPYPDDKPTAKWLMKRFNKLDGFIGANLSSTFIVYLLFDTKENAENGKKKMESYNVPCGEVAQAFIPTENATKYEDRRKNQ